MNDRTSDLATHAAEAIRELNHLTFDPGTIPVPDSYTIIAELAAMAHRLPQLLDQLAANLAARENQNGLRLDAIGTARYPTTSAAIGKARQALADAAHTAGVLALVLTDAQNTTATVADHGPRKG